jgi:hypothetical protein
MRPAGRPVAGSVGRDGDEDVPAEHGDGDGKAADCDHLHQWREGDTERDSERRAEPDDRTEDAAGVGDGDATDRRCRAGAVAHRGGSLGRLAMGRKSSVTSTPDS